MRYSGIQPQYFPRLHYFSRIINTDVFVIRDDVQFVRKHKYPEGRVDKSYQADTIIKQPDGKYYLSVPIKHEGVSSIRKIKISYQQAWMFKHLPTIRGAYAKSLNFPKFFPEIEQILRSKPSRLLELNLMTIIWGLNHLLGAKLVDLEKLKFNKLNKMLAKQKLIRLKEIRLASKLKSINKTGNLSANEKIIEIIKEVGVDEDYCGGTAISAYMDQKLFADNGIQITMQNWTCREYPQRFMHQLGFIPNLSIIDLLMNVPMEEARQILSE